MRIKTPGREEQEKPQYKQRLQFACKHCKRRHKNLLDQGKCNLKHNKINNQRTEEKRERIRQWKRCRSWIQKNNKRQMCTLPIDHKGTHMYYKRQTQ